MTFYTTAEEPNETSPFDTRTVCPCCGEPSDGPTVAWDLEIGQPGLLTRVLFHRECALKMAQGMIVDGWGNRHKGNKLT